MRNIFPNMVILKFYYDYNYKRVRINKKKVFYYMLIEVALFYLTIFTVASASQIDLGAGNFLRTVCNPSHPTSLNGNSDYVCTLKERDFYPQNINKAVQGLKVMAQADMVKELQIVLARNLLKMKKENQDKLEVYKKELGGDEEFKSLVLDLIQGGWETESFDYGFELYEQFEMNTNVLLTKETPKTKKLIERLAQRKPKLVVKLFNILKPYEKISASINDPSGIVLDKLLAFFKDNRSDLKSVFTEFAPHFCQKTKKEIPFDKFNLIFEYFEETEANILKAIKEICYSKKFENALEMYTKYKNENLIKEAAYKSNNHKTTLEILKLENRTEILNVLNLFSSQEQQQEKLLELLKQINFFIEISKTTKNDLLKVIIENGLESNDIESGAIITKAIRSLEAPVQVNLHLRGLGKVYINTDVKTAVQETSQVKFKFTPISLAALIKDDHLFTFIKEFGGNESFFKKFDVDQPDVLLTYLNKEEDFHAAFQLFNLKSGNKLYESDFLVESLSSSLEKFHQTEHDSSKIFLMMRRPQVEYLISKFKADLFPQLPNTFVDALKETQEL